MTAGKGKTALFAGTFNPFTRGHQRIVERAFTMAGRVIIAVGCNIGKEAASDLTERVENIRVIFAEDPRVEVTAYSGLTADFAKSAGADFLLRGVRDVKDFEYERNLADINLRILGIDTVLMIAEPEFASLSSSTVRELEKFGFDVSPLLPSAGKDKNVIK